MKISANPLPNPPDGYEWREQPQILNRESITFVLCPIRKLYDWSKTAHHALVNDGCGIIRTFCGESYGDTSLAEGVWQAHIGGDPCPVYPDATMVETRRNMTSVPASYEDWSRDQIYRVTGLVEGYSYVS